MDALTDAGKGAHVFLPDVEEVEVSRILSALGCVVLLCVPVAASEIRDTTRDARAEVAPQVGCDEEPPLLSAGATSAANVDAGASSGSVR